MNIKFLSEKRAGNLFSHYNLMDSAERILCGAIDFKYSKHVQPFPEKSNLINCKIISHRGEYDNRSIFENTLKAFDRVSDKGVFGIEFDIRWTRDLKPVVLHDKNTTRLYNKDIDVNEACFSDLRTSAPEIPSLEEVISRYGKRLHLMAEIKQEIYPEPLQQAGILKNLFSDLMPGKDYHFISLSPEIFSIIDFVPKSTFIPIARLNLRSMSQIALQSNYGGVAGHYLLVTNSLIRKHMDKNQKIGTGFVDSENCLFRELNRGTEWIFSNNAAKLQTIINSSLKLPVASSGELQC
ncbi:MAG: glycerophosphodiester phosphodiesterase family protein [Pseudomonadota bacterium]